MDPVVGGVVLAAGRSRRMGTPKALLEVHGTTFLDRAIGALREGGCTGVSVTVRGVADPDARRIAARARAAGARVVEVVPEPREQIDSLRAALRLLEGADAAVVLPVDLPRIGPPVVAALIAAFRRSAAPIVVPSHGGRHGHPVLFSRRVFAELLADPLPDGARTVVHAHATELEEVEVDADGVLLDVNTPADYRRVVSEARPPR